MLNVRLPPADGSRRRRFIRKGKEYAQSTIKAPEPSQIQLSTLCLPTRIADERLKLLTAIGNAFISGRAISWKLCRWRIGGEGLVRWVWGQRKS